MLPSELPNVSCSANHNKLIYNNQMDTTKRLDSILSDRGFCARRKVEAFLNENTVTVNSKRVKEPGFRIKIVSDEIIINGKKLELQTTQEDLVYYLVNKPKGVLVASSDNRKKTVLNLVPKGKRVYPVGPLDELSSGLILLTNDGDLAHKLTNPKFNIPKTYLVWVVGNPSEKRLDRIREGMKLKEGLTKPVGVTVLKTSPKRTLIEVILNEGKNHQIRAMFKRVGVNIVELKRVSMGPINLNFLGIGKHRILTEKEVSDLQKATTIEDIKSIQK
jgi:pseudouridine synthase